MTRQKWVSILLLVVAGVLVFFALRAAPWSEIWAALQRLQSWQIAVFVLLNLAIFGLFSLRWWAILRILGYRVPYAQLTGYRLASFSVSYFTPGPHFGGEPLQVQWLRTRHKIPTSAALASVTLDKLFELLANFTFLVCGVLIVVGAGILPGTVRLPLIPIVVVLMLLPMFYLLALATGRTPLSRIIPQRGRWASAAALVRDAEAQSIQFLAGRTRVVFVMGAISLGIWFAMVAEYWLLLYFLDGRLTLIETVSMLTAARIAILFPLPAGLGTLEASQVIAAQMVGLSPALGVTVVLLIRARDVTFGLVGLWWGGRYRW